MAERRNGSARMVGVVAKCAGGPEVLRLACDLPVRQPQKGTVRVRVLAASVNPIDVRRRGGYGRRLLSLVGAARFPLVLGNDLAGVVDAVGPGVTAWKRGQRVFGCTAASRLGTHAQFAIVPADQLLAIREGMRDDEAASLPYAFVTAYRALTIGLDARPEDFRGKAVLVHGGAGAVGSMCVQMLRAWGADVGLSGRRAAPAGRFDAIVNCASFDDEAILLRMLGPGSMGLATIVHPLMASLDAHGWIGGALSARGVWKGRAAAVRAVGGRRYRWVLFKPTPAALAELDRLLRRGAIVPRVGAVFPLDRAETAHRAVEQGGTAGKVVLRVAHGDRRDGGLA